MKNINKYDVNLIFHRKEIEDSNIYKMARNRQFGNLKVDGKEYKFYNIWVQTLIFWNINSKANENTKRININSKHYSNSYVNGYMRGQQYFIEKYENDIRETKETIVKNIMNLNKEVNKVLTVNQYVLNDSLSNETKFVFETEEIENFVPGGKARWTINKIQDNQIETIFDVSFPGEEYACFGTNKQTKVN